MYTQCNHCKAIFRIDMKEVTVAKGQIRCGECLNVFNAVESLSTSMPEKHILSDKNYSEDEVDSIKSMDDWQSSSDTPPRSNNKPESSGTIFLISLFLLTFLLMAQILYQNPSLISDQPPQRNPDKIEMLNYNVFAHPSEANVLLITGAIQNNAQHTQPFPTLEVSLSDPQSKVIGLSRFSPSEYLTKTTHTNLLPTGTPVKLSLKIKDPGNNATHFKFGFK